MVDKIASIDREGEAVEGPEEVPEGDGSAVGSGEVTGVEDIPSLLEIQLDNTETTRQRRLSWLTMLR